MEAVLLVERDRSLVVPVDAEADAGEAARTGLLEQRADQGTPHSLAARVRNDRNGKLRRALVDEAVAGRACLEETEPGCADGEAVDERDHRRIAPPSPRLDVELHRAGALVRLALLPVVGVMQHVAQEANVLRATSPNDDGHAYR